MNKGALLIPKVSGDPVIDLALDTVRIKKQALVFVGTKRSAEKTAEDVAKKLKLSSRDLDELSEKILKALPKPTKQCERLAFCVKRGVAFHHSGLTSLQKELVEDSFRSGLLKIICCTPTLAIGVDTPAFRAIIKDLRRFGNEEGLSWIPVLEYLQMAGRAGRPKYDSYGEAIVIAGSDSVKDEIRNRYLNGVPEDIFSKLAVEPALRTYILSLIATEFVNTKKEIIDFFSKTFWAFQYGDFNRLEQIILKMLKLLEEFEFIKCSGKDDFVSASELNVEKYSATILGKRVAELYIDPLTAFFLISCVRRASSQSFNDFSLLQMVCDTIEVRPLLRVKASEFDEIQEQIVLFEDVLLVDEPSLYEPEYDDFTASVKTALMLFEWINEKDEEFLLEKYNVRPGELRVKLDVADWLLYSAYELTRILKFQPILKEISKLRFRLKYGAKEELVALLQLKNIGRVRARKLFNNKIKDLADVKKTDITVLAHILGKAVAIDVKEQVGQKVDMDKVPEGKRRGQISLGDYL